MFGGDATWIGLAAFKAAPKHPAPPFDGAVSEERAVRPALMWSSEE